MFRLQSRSTGNRHCKCNCIALKQHQYNPQNEKILFLLRGVRSNLSKLRMIRDATAFATRLVFCLKTVAMTTKNFVLCYVLGVPIIEQLQQVPQVQHGRLAQPHQVMILAKNLNV